MALSGAPPPLNTQHVLPRDFSRVEINLENCVLPENRLLNTPSAQDGLLAETEEGLRNIGCEIMQTMGILLKLPQTAIATSQVLFQRFYYSKSFVKHPMHITAIAAIYLAGKIEEDQRWLRDCINVYNHIKQVKSGQPFTPLAIDDEFFKVKNEVIKAERRILKELGFCCYVKHSHKLLILIINLHFGLQKRKDFMQAAWNYMNDSFRTSVFLQYRPNAIACACVWLAARRLKIVLPQIPGSTKSWYHIYDVSQDQVETIAAKILSLYARAEKLSLDELEASVALAKKMSLARAAAAKCSSPAIHGTTETPPHNPSASHDDHGSRHRASTPNVNGVSSSSTVNESKHRHRHHHRDDHSRRSRSPSSRHHHSGSSHSRRRGGDSKEVSSSKPSPQVEGSSSQQPASTSDEPDGDSKHHTSSDHDRKKMNSSSHRHHGRSSDSRKRRSPLIESSLQSQVDSSANDTPTKQRAPFHPSQVLTIDDDESCPDEDEDLSSRILTSSTDNKPVTKIKPIKYSRDSPTTAPGSVSPPPKRLPAAYEEMNNFADTVVSTSSSSRKRHKHEKRSRHMVPLEDVSSSRYHEDYHRSLSSPKRHSKSRDYDRERGDSRSSGVRSSVVIRR